MIQKYGLGDNEILVELPGIDDPGKVEDAIKSTSKLAVYAVVSGPYDERPGGADGAGRNDSAGRPAGAWDRDRRPRRTRCSC